MDRSIKIFFKDLLSRMNASRGEMHVYLLAILVLSNEDNFVRTCPCLNMVVELSLKCVDN